MGRGLLRLYCSLACFSAWLVLLILGHAFGGAIHLALLAALLLFPWRQAVR
jgi:hypothetical protein